MVKYIKCNMIYCSRITNYIKSNLFFVFDPFIILYVRNLGKLNLYAGLIRSSHWVYIAIDSWIRSWRSESYALTICELSKDVVSGLSDLWYTSTTHCKMINVAATKSGMVLLRGPPHFSKEPELVRNINYLIIIECRLLFFSNIMPNS